MAKKTILIYILVVLLVAPLINANGWCWFQDPKAVHHNDITYVSWVDMEGDIEIWSYNHKTEEKESFTLRKALHVDDHASPSILILKDSRLMVFYSAHSGTNMYYRISTNPNDISSWGEEQTIIINPYIKYTYPNPIYLEDEDLIYLFYRMATSIGMFPTFSIYNGSWSNQRRLLVTGDSKQIPYMKVISNNKDEIHFAVTDGHPHNFPNNSIYHFYYKNNSFYNTDGTYITDINNLPIRFENLTKSYDATITNERAFIWDIALKDGKPYMTYSIVENITNHQYKYAFWDGTKWINKHIIEGGGYIDGISQPEYSGGVVLDQDNPDIIYLSKEINGVFEIQKATTNNNGDNWLFESITSDSIKDNVRPGVIRNHTSDFNVVWMYGHYIYYTNYPTDIMGDKMWITSTYHNLPIKEVNLIIKTRQEGTSALRIIRDLLKCLFTNECGSVEIAIKVFG